MNIHDTAITGFLIFMLLPLALVYIVSWFEPKTDESSKVKKVNER